MQRFSAIAFLLLIPAAGCSNSQSRLVPSFVAPDRAIPMHGDGVSTDVTVTITIPNPTATPRLDPTWSYVSPGTKSIRIVVNGEVRVNVLPSSPGCHSTSNGTQCTFDTIPAIKRAVQSAVVECFDQTLGAKNTLRGKMLSYGNGKVVVRYAKQPIGLVLHPILDSIAGSLSNAAPPAGKVTLSQLNVVPKDPDGYVIPGPSTYYYAESQYYARPASIFASISEPNMQEATGFTLVVKGPPPPSGSAGPLSRTSDILFVRYSGRGAHKALLQLTVPRRHSLELSIKPQPGVGRTLAIPSVGVSSSISLAPSGDLWFSEPAQHAVAFIDPAGKRIKQIPIPSGNTPGQIVAYGVATPQQNAHNLADILESNNTIGWVDPHYVVHEYELPEANAGLSGIWNDGWSYYDIWFTESNTSKIGKLYYGKYLSEYNAPKGSTPTALYDGCFADPGHNAIGFAHSDGGIGEYALPHPDSNPTSVTVVQQSSLCWFTEGNAARVGSVDLGSGKIREYHTHAPLRFIVTGPDGWVYAIDNQSNVEMIDPTGHTTVIPNPVAGSSLVSLTPGANGDLWSLSSTASTSKITEILY